MYQIALTVVLSLIVIAGSVPSAYAGDDCNNPCGKDRCICHNIGGPDDLGANCDMTGTCTYPLDGQNLTLAPHQFLGIIIGFNQDQPRALGAHIGHGDGPIVTTFDPPLHLASTAGPHRASNVECVGRRILDQPSEPGN